MKRMIFLLSVCAFLLTSCDGLGAEQDQVAGGFGSETTNGVMVTGSSEVGTVLIARRLDRVEAPYRTRVDASGDFRLKLQPGSWGLTGQIAGKGFALNVVLDAADSAVSIGWTEFKSLETLSGRVVGLEGRAAFAGLRVWLPVMGLCVPVDSQGAFRIDDLPSGPYVVRLTKDNEVLAEAFGHTGSAPEVVLNPDRDELLLDDFDDADPYPSLAALLPGTEWWAFDGLVAIVPDDGERPRHFDSLATDAGALSGRSLHLPSGLGPSAAGLGFGSCGLGSANVTYHDLSGSDSLVFYAKGSGTLSLKLWARNKTDENDGSSPHFPVGVLGSDWKRYAVAWKDFHGSDEVPLGCQFKNLEVHKILFQYENGDLWLDDIRILGGTPSMFLR